MPLEQLGRDMAIARERMVMDLLLHPEKLEALQEEADRRAVEEAAWPFKKCELCCPRPFFEPAWVSTVNRCLLRDGAWYVETICGEIMPVSDLVRVTETQEDHPSGGMLFRYTFHDVEREQAHA